MKDAMMRTVIFLRTDTDWAGMDMEKFEAQLDHFISAPSLPWVITSGIIKCWNEIFSMAYWEFRLRIRALARPSIDAVRGAEVIEGLDALRAELARDTEPTYIIPTDDDDFFRASLAELVAVEQAPVLTWPVSVSYKNQCRRSRRKRPFRTNSYAVRKDVMQSLPDAEMPVVATRCTRAGRILRAHGHRPVQITNAILGMAPKHAGSVSVLRTNGIKSEPDAFPHVLRRIVRRYNRMPKGARPDWSVEYYRKMVALHQELERVQ